MATTDHHKEDREVIENMEMILKEQRKDLTKRIDLSFPKDKKANFSYLDINKMSMKKVSEIFYPQNMEFYRANIVLSLSKKMLKVK